MFHGMKHLDKSLITYSRQCVIVVKQNVYLIDNINKCTTIKILILVYLLVLSTKLFINAQTRIP